jgi:hypothetical protein
MSWSLALPEPVGSTSVTVRERHRNQKRRLRVARRVRCCSLCCERDGSTSTPTAGQHVKEEQAKVNSATQGKIVSFIWGIADDILRDLYVRGKYRDVILLHCAPARSGQTCTCRSRTSQR